MVGSISKQTLVYSCQRWREGIGDLIHKKEGNKIQDKRGIINNCSITMHDLGNERIVNTYTRAAGEIFPVKCLKMKEMKART